MPVTFQAYRHPALQAGWYRLTAHQRISARGGTARRVRRPDQGPRHRPALHAHAGADPQPPSGCPGSTGDFSAVLPHIALTVADAALAARADAERDARGSDGRAVAGVARLRQLRPRARSRDRAALVAARVRAVPRVAPARRRASAPATCASGSTSTRELLAKVAPEVDELRWLTHVRSDDQAGPRRRRGQPAPADRRRDHVLPRLARGRRARPAARGRGRRAAPGAGGVDVQLGDRHRELRAG